MRRALQDQLKALEQLSTITSRGAAQRDVAFQRAYGKLLAQVLRVLRDVRADHSGERSYAPPGQSTKLRDWQPEETGGPNSST